MTNEQAREMADAMNMTISSFQTGFATIMKENPLLETGEHISLTKIWWDGVMNMIGASAKRSDNDKNCLM